jgi:integrase
MARRKTRLARRPDSQNGQFEERVPADVVDRLRGRSIVFTFPDDAPDASVPITPKIGDRVRVSLRTSDGALYARRKAALQAHLAALYEAARRGPTTLPRMTIEALSGEVYRLFVERFQEEPGSPAMWAAVKGFNRAAREGRTQYVPALRPDGVMADPALASAAFGDALTEGINALPPSPEFVPPALERRFGWLTDWVLAKHRLVVDAESRAKLITAAERASTEAALALKRNATGDYTPDPVAARFPPVRLAPPSTQPSRTFETLFDEYVRFPGKGGTRRPRTIAEYRKTFTEDFAGFIRDHAKHQDPGRVVTTDVVAWRDALLAKGLSPKTIKDKRLAAVRAVYARAKRDGKLPTNPVAGVEMRAVAKPRERERGFTDDEAKAILRAAANFKPGRHSPEVAAAIRWAPWIGAYTGARIAEITQLRGRDFKQTGDGWVIHFTPEAGTTKTNEDRTVPVHSHLIDQGLIEVAKASGDGPLFYRPEKPGKVSPKRAQATAGRVSEWVRDGAMVTDRRVQPTHGWRHRFKTIARRADMDEDARKYIPGHTLPGMEGVYGDMAGLHREIEKLPRIKLDDEPLPRQDENP